MQYVRPVERIFMQSRKILHTPSKSILNKMKSACEHRPDMALELFTNEVMNIPQSLTPDGVSLYHGTKSDISKRFESDESIPEKEAKSAIVLEITGIPELSVFLILLSLFIITL